MPRPPSQTKYTWKHHSRDWPLPTAVKPRATPMGETRERKRARTMEHTPAHDHDQDWFVGSIDQGTTSSRFLIFNKNVDPVASHQIEFKNHYPVSG